MSCMGFAEREKAEQRALEEGFSSWFSCSSSSALRVSMALEVKNQKPNQFKES